MPRRAMYDLFDRNIDADRLTRALLVLEAGGLALREEPGTPRPAGRPEELATAQVVFS